MCLGEPLSVVSRCGVVGGGGRAWWRGRVGVWAWWKGGGRRDSGRWVWGIEGLRVALHWPLHVLASLESPSAPTSSSLRGRLPVDPLWCSVSESEGAFCGQAQGLDWGR